MNTVPNRIQTVALCILTVTTFAGLAPTANANLSFQDTQLLVPKGIQLQPL